MVATSRPLVGTPGHLSLPFVYFLWRLDHVCSEVRHPPPLPPPLHFPVRPAEGTNPWQRREERPCKEVTWATRPFSKTHQGALTLRV